MNSENPQEPGATSATPAPAPGLPPVTPPSGRFIAQLFLVPGLIVAVAVLLLLAFRYLFGGGHAPDYFLRQLQSEMPTSAGAPPATWPRSSTGPRTSRSAAICSSHLT
jgi:hypothetical protein